jgi:hypothetical protein
MAAPKFPWGNFAHLVAGFPRDSAVDLPPSRADATGRDSNNKPLPPIGSSISTHRGSSTKFGKVERLALHPGESLSLPSGEDGLDLIEHSLIELVRSRTQTGLFLFFAFSLLLGAHRFEGRNLGFERFTKLPALANQVRQYLVDLLELLVIELERTDDFGPTQCREPVALKHNLLDASSLAPIEHLIGTCAFGKLLLLGGRQLQLELDRRLTQ